MTRVFAFLAALLLSALAVTSACTAAQAEGGAIRFTLEPGHKDASRVHVQFRNRIGGGNNSWSTDLGAAELSGLDLRRLRSQATGPVRFAMGRDAGRLDCAGHGGHGMATGTCRFTPNAEFIHTLVARGLNRPSESQAFSLMAVNVRRDILDALGAAHYPVPTVDNLISLTAVGVSGPYISSLAHAGYRPKDLDTLLEFKALDITPEWIHSFVRLGYGNLPADELVQLKALGIDGPFVAGFERIGYRRVAADELVEFKALGITPEFVAGFRRVGYNNLTADELVQLKALGITPDFAARVSANGKLPSADRLVEMRVGADILRGK